METAWELAAPLAAGLGAAAELFRRFVLVPHMEARRAERETFLARLSRVEEEISATRREIHELTGLILSGLEARRG